MATKRKNHRPISAVQELLQDMRATLCHKMHARSHVITAKRSANSFFQIGSLFLWTASKYCLCNDKKCRVDSLFLRFRNKVFCAHKKRGSGSWNENMVGIQQKYAVRNRLFVVSTHTDTRTGAQTYGPNFAH